MSELRFTFGVLDSLLTGDSNLRLTNLTLASLTEGSSTLRVTNLRMDPLTEGESTLWLTSIRLDPLSEGYSKLRVTALYLEALIPIPLEEYMTTDVFPGFGNSTGDPSIPAGADPFNSNLPGLAFSVHKKPSFNTRITPASAGPEVRNALMRYPIWNFELTYEFLEDASGADSSLKSLMGFFLECQGSFNQWLFKDPDDYHVTVDQVQAIADGVTTEFPIVRVMGNFAEQVGQIDTDNDVNFYADGVLIDPADYTITMPNLIVFDVAPADTVEITADFQFFFVCRFADDMQDYEKFMDKLWSLQTCDFRSIIQ